MRPPEAPADADRRIAELEARLAEAQELLHAIGSGEVDAVVVGGDDPEGGGRRVFTLEGADRPYRLLIEQMREGAVTMSPDGLVLYCNGAFAEMVGEPAPRIVGTLFSRFVDLPAARVAAMLARLGRVEAPLRSRGGGMLATQLSLGLLDTEDGALVCAVVTDLSDARSQAQALAAANDRLQVEMAERARTEEALRQSQKLEAIGQLTGGVAHDFNNLLTIIRSSVDLLRRREVSDEKKRRYVDAISDTADRAAKLTGQLLAYARKQPLRPEAFDVAARVRGAVEMLGTTVGSRVRIELEAADAPCFVEADANQFETALLNMAVNARDAMDGEGVLRITVGETADGEPDAGFVAVTVADTGPGIPADRLQRIFEPFFTTKGVGKGTGLGLSQVYGFAKQSGGEVRVESPPGAGAAFTLLLPRVAAREATSPDEAEPMPGAQRGRILLVEDNAPVGEVAAQLLGELGYTVSRAEDAAAALAMVAAEDDGFDLVFSDVVMPGRLSGVDLARALARLRPDLPVVLTTGYSEALADGGVEGVALLRKPYSVEALSRTIRRAMRAPARPAA